MFGSTIRSVTRRVMCRTAGFTLVELLVVIGIIALLISILLPVLNKARESANRAACLSNQKQIIAAMLMYANDHKQYLPGPAVSCINNPLIVNSPNPNSTSSFSLMDVWNTTPTASGLPGFYAARELSHMNLLGRYLSGPGYAGLRVSSYTVGNAMSGVEVNIQGTKTVWRCPSAAAMWENATAVSTGQYHFPGKALGYGYLINNSSQAANTSPTYLFGDYTSLSSNPSAQEIIDHIPKRIPQLRFVVKVQGGPATAYTSDATQIWLLSDVDGRNFSASVNPTLAFVDGLSTDQLTQKNARPWQPVHNNGHSVAQGEVVPSSLGRNYAYLDGHAAWVPYGEWPAAINAGAN